MDPPPEDDEASTGLLESGLLSSGESDSLFPLESSNSYSEEEVRLSSEAFKAYDSGDLPRAQSTLEALSALRPSDPCVSGNLALVSYLSQKNKNSLAEFNGALQEILEKEVGEPEPEALGTILYNKALACILNRQQGEAEATLLRLTALLSRSDRGGEDEEEGSSFLKKVNKLLCRVYVLTKQDESLSRSLETTSTQSEHFSFFKAHSQLLSKNFKALKKDLKESSSEDNPALEFLRANCEYLKGNPRKAQKLLSHLGPSLGGRERVYHANNMGLVQLMQDKPHLAAHTFMDALDKNEEMTRVEGGEYLLKNKKMEISYNLALGLLHTGRHTEMSFETFLKTLPLYQRRSSLWLHLAECCIQSYQQLHSVPSYADSVSSIKDAKTTTTPLNSIGPMAHQKIILRNPSGSSHPLHPPKNKNLNLDFGLSCLRNAGILLQSDPRRKQDSLQASILLNGSYVSLLLQDFTTALAKANELLDFFICYTPSEPLKDAPTYKLLGHLYAGEALIHLDRISEATSHLGPNTLQSLEQGYGESTGDTGSSQPYAGLGSSTLNFNLSVAFALRGELDKAKGLLERSTGPKSLELTTKFTMMNLYIHIMKKDMKTCRDIISKKCNLVQLPPPTPAK